MHIPSFSETTVFEKTRRAFSAEHKIKSFCSQKRFLKLHSQYTTMGTGFENDNFFTSFANIE